MPQEEPDSKISVQKTLAIPRSIAEVKNRVQEKPQAPQQPPVLTQENPSPDSGAPSQPEEALEQHAVQEVLDGIIVDLKEKGKHMEIAVIRQPFQIDGSSILFLLNGEIQKDIFEKIKPEITGKLKKSLSYPQLEVSFKINSETTDSVAKLYTSSDKLRYLREKSPALKELQKRFGLETDF